RSTSNAGPRTIVRIGRAPHRRSMRATVAVLTMVATLGIGSPHPSISWHGCRTGAGDTLGQALDAAGAQCGEVAVPLDYRHPHGRTITVAMSRLKAAPPLGTLMINPAGPGLPGLEQVLIGQYL